MPVDPRFFEPVQTFTISEIAGLTGAQIKGEEVDREITGVAAASDGRGGDVVFFEGRPKDTDSVSSHAAACFVTQALSEHMPDTLTCLIVDAPRLSHIAVTEKMFRLRGWSDDGNTAQIHETAKIGPGACIGANAAIGAGTEIGPNAVIGPGVQIGADCRIGPNVSVRCALIGNNVTILAGVVIGEAGFGVVASAEGAQDIPQLGRVVIQDHVTIGSNSTIDRGAFTDTVIGERSKIDNLCHIGHNAVLGRNVLLAAFAGVSGSSELGDGVMAGGRVGVADHVKVGAGASLAASSGIMRDVPEGQAWAGIPAKPLRQWMRELSWLQKQAAARKKSN